MAELLRTTVVIGMPHRTAVSKSSPVMPNAASPMKFTQNLSGAASLAPMIRPRPVPSACDLPQPMYPRGAVRSEEHTSELQSRLHLVCRLLLEKKKKISSKTLV